jgi:hypothetical protein
VPRVDQRHPGTDPDHHHDQPARHHVDHRGDADHPGAEYVDDDDIVALALHHRYVPTGGRSERYRTDHDHHHPVGACGGFEQHHLDHPLNRLRRPRGA